MVHILIVYADFSRCRARFSWWDFVTTASPRKFEISYHYTCSSLLQNGSKKTSILIKRSKGLDKTSIFDLFYQNWPRFFSFCNIIVAKGRKKCLWREKILVENWQVHIVTNTVSIKFSSVMFFWVSAFLWTPR